MNYRGLYTLYAKEVNRFISVYIQTLIAPMINTLLLLAIFSLAFKSKVGTIEGIEFNQFIIPGLIMMTIIQQAFANTSSTLTFNKVLGIIIDMLIPPLSAKEIAIALPLAGITRGVVSGAVVALVVVMLGLVADSSIMPEIHHFWIMIFYVFSAALLLSLLGMIAGILSDSFDQMSAYTSFVITPLSFLSGTFYSIKSLPEFWQMVSHFNPFFYLIDGFRYSMTGHNDFDIATGMVFITGLNIVLYSTTYIMLKKGYRLKN